MYTGPKSDVCFQLASGKIYNSYTNYPTYLTGDHCTDDNSKYAIYCTADVHSIVKLFPVSSYN